MGIITYKTSSPAGDLISFLAGIKKIWEDTGNKGIIYHRLEMEGASYPGASHPFKNKQGDVICFNNEMFKMMKPLICSQEYIEDYCVYTGQLIDVDFDKVRLEVFTNQPLGSLNRWPFYVWPQMACDLSMPWLFVSRENRFGNKIIINFTERYRNPTVNYFFLKKWEKDIVFVGLPHECKIFNEKWGLCIPYFKPDNFYYLATAISGCKFFLGNASFCFQLAEALKVPRILETFQYAPNVIPTGINAYDFYHQESLEYYFDKLVKK